MDITDGIILPFHWFTEKRCMECTCGKELNHEEISKEVREWVEGLEGGYKVGSQELKVSIGYLRKLLNGQRLWTGELALLAVRKVYDKEPEVWTKPLPGVKRVPVPVHVAPVRKAGEPWREVKPGEIVLRSGNIVRLAVPIGEKEQKDPDHDAGAVQGDQNYDKGSA